MGAMIDIIGILIIAIAAFTSYRKGFVRTFFGLITVIVAILLASMFHKTLAAYIKDSTGLDEWINSFVSESTATISKDVNSGNLGKGTSFSTDALGAYTTGMQELFPEGNALSNLPDVLSEKIGLDELKTNVAENISTKLSDGVINVLSWFIIYLVAQIILSIVVAILDGIMSLPLLREVNNIAGLGIGILIGIFRIYLVLAIVYFISSVVNISPVVGAIANSGMVGAMYNNNLLLQLIF